MSESPPKSAAPERLASPAANVAPATAVTPADAVPSTNAPVAATVSSSPLVTTPAPQPELVPAQDPECSASSTASITSSILEYRTIQGRTYHSDRHPTEYFTPNDEQQRESVDINHHSLTLLIGGKLFLAPISDNPKKVLDVGTGTGIWAIDFADEYPNTEVIGSDLSPIQPHWVPPNVKFEIDDARLPWSWKDDTFDFVHIRYLFGAIHDWKALFRQAYRCCAPGGWVQSCEADVEIRSDDGTTDNIPALKQWARLYSEGGNIKIVNYKFPVSGWPKDPTLAEVGRYVNLTLENDLEGYTLMLWHNVLKLPSDEYQVFLMDMRRVLRNRKIHGYMSVRYVYGRKPE
ncbi:hypothetical protein QQX98_010715 [Neonectria punicea]|uniref:Methyltransferase n=1 Tax=Neonectria punicea TaxID=979145 RepID=A0ABR1GNU2_9HYPO